MTSSRGVMAKMTEGGGGMKPRILDDVICERSLSDDVCQERSLTSTTAPLI